MTSMEQRLDERLESIEQATGMNGRQPKKGIAQRLDAIEDTQEAILERLDDLESA